MDDDDSSEAADHLRMVVYLLFLGGSVFVGPLEAVLGLAVYWLFDSEETESTPE
ncbi:hypothetical protein [Halorussus pelagicus]|uniref:hypothetical protein n=1 Tax=Halorussus pelagicus TaxID=2505977 RepID=UPI001407F879|nr:hypothetical protein [Halorussus pelagicus]